MLVSDTDERALLSEDRPGRPRRRSQSPERELAMNLANRLCSCIPPVLRWRISCPL